jgi:hypothetical protein
MQNLKAKFETPRMSKDQYISGYMLWVDEIVNAINGLGKTKTSTHQQPYTI